jgi:hypothetical protein
MIDLNARRARVIEMREMSELEERQWELAAEVFREACGSAVWGRREDLEEDHRKELRLCAAKAIRYAKIFLEEWKKYKEEKKSCRDAS